MASDCRLSSFHLDGCHLLIGDRPIVALEANEQIDRVGFRRTGRCLTRPRLCLDDDVTNRLDGDVTGGLGGDVTGCLGDVTGDVPGDVSGRRGGEVRTRLAVRRAADVVDMQSEVPHWPRLVEVDDDFLQLTSEADGQGARLCRLESQHAVEDER